MCGLHIRYAVSLELAMRAGTQILAQVSSAERNLVTICPSSRGLLFLHLLATIVLLGRQKIGK